LSASSKSQIPLKQYFAVALIKGFAKLPLPLSQFIGRFVGRLNWWFGKNLVHFTKTNIAHCLPHLDPQQQQQLAKASLLSAGELVAEFSSTWLWSAEKLAKLDIDCESLESLEKASQSGKGVLLLSPHLGNWEMLLPIITPHFEVVAMYKPPRMKALDALIRQVREKDGAAVVPANSAGIRSIFKAVKKGKITILLPDQEPAENAGIFVPFFNQPAWTMTLPAKMIQKTQCAVVFSAVVRTPNGYKLIIRRAEEFSHESSIAEISAAINRHMETLVLEYPEQYQWSYKRFYRQPDGQPQIYI